MSSLAESAGIDVWRCEFCDRKVRKDRPHFTAMDGMRAHNVCVEAFRKRERAADRRDARAAIEKVPKYPVYLLGQPALPAAICHAVIPTRELGTRRCWNRVRVGERYCWRHRAVSLA